MYLDIYKCTLHIFSSVYTVNIKVQPYLVHPIILGLYVAVFQQIHYTVWLLISWQCELSVGITVCCLSHLLYLSVCMYVQILTCEFILAVVQAVCGYSCNLFIPLHYISICINTRTSFICAYLIGSVKTVYGYSFKLVYPMCYCLSGQWLKHNHADF